MLWLGVAVRCREHKSLFTCLRLGAGCSRSWAISHTELAWLKVLVLRAAVAAVAGSLVAGPVGAAAFWVALVRLLALPAWVYNIRYGSKFRCVSKGLLLPVY